GFELENTLEFHRFFTEIALEYIYNQQIEDKYPLPFTPPSNVFMKLNYTISENQNTTALVSGKYFAQQNRIARNDEITDAAILFNSAISSLLTLGNTQIYASRMVQNMLNTRYFKHSSSYRSSEIPEQRRNIQLIL